MRHKSRLSKYNRVEFYRTESGRVPFKDWYRKLDASTKARVFRRIERLEYYGEFGSHRFLSGHPRLMELKFYMGPGYRIYGALVFGAFLILLAGDKSTQKQDIKTARKYLEDFMQNWYEGEGEE